MKKLFVGGLSWGTDDGSLRAAFEEHGAVREALVITDRETGRSRGFGFVSFENDNDAKVALAEMHEAMLDGRRVSVSIAEERGNGRRDDPRPRPPQRQEREPEIFRRRPGLVNTTFMDPGISAEEARISQLVSEPATEPEEKKGGGSPPRRWSQR